MKMVSEKKIIELILQNNPYATFGDNPRTTNLFENWILDSLSVVQLALAIEESFEIVFDYRDLNAVDFGSIEKLEALLVSKYGLTKE